MRKIICVFSFMLLAICVLHAGSVCASDDITVRLNGKKLDFDASPFMENERVMVPIRAISEAMNAEVNWTEIFLTPQDPAPLQRVRINTEESEIIMNIGNNTFIINGESVKLDSMPVIKNDRTFVPVRFFCEAFDASVEWKDESRTVHITKNKTFGLADGIIGFGMPLGTEIKKENPDFCESDEYLEFENDGSKITVHAENLRRTSVGNLEKDCENLGFECEKGENLSFDAQYVKSDDKIGIITANPDGRLVLIKINYDGENGRVFAQECLENISFHEYAYPDAVNVEGYRVTRLDGKYEVQNLSADDKDHFRIIKIVPSSENQPMLDVEFSESEIVTDTRKTDGEVYYGTLFENPAKWNMIKDKEYSLHTSGKCSDSSFYYISGKAYSENQQREFIKIIAHIIRRSNEIFAAKKPVIYLYPEKETEVSVEVKLNGEFIFTYPEYKTGWNVTAFPDGKIISGGEEYSYLFWEGTMPELNTEITEGFVVKGSESTTFLRNTLKKMGLTPKEYNEFIVYWAPILEQNEYNKIYFADDEYISQAQLNITPKPDSVLRIFMIYEKADVGTVLPPQEIKTFERNGFTVVEWGGSIQ